MQLNGEVVNFKGMAVVLLICTCHLAKSNNFKCIMVIKYSIPLKHNTFNTSTYLRDLYIQVYIKIYTLSTMAVP